MKLTSPELGISLLPIFLCFLPVQGAVLEGASAEEQIDAGIAAFRSAVGEDNWQKLQNRLMSLNQDISQKGMLPFPGTSDKLLTGYAYHEFYDWDLYFENLYLSYYGIDDYCFANFKVFLSRQKPDGFISRTLNQPRPEQMFKPFLAQIAILGSRQRGDDYEWLRASYYEGLRRYLDRWFAYDADKNGLPVWDSSDASGMDNQVSRAGEKHSFQDEGVDLACYLHRELEAMALIAGKLGKPEDQKSFQDRADALAREINAVFWDDRDGFYYDRNEKTGKRNRVKSVAGFTPLWAGIASPEQARRLVMEHLTNEREFWLKYPVASYAATEPDFYEGRHGGECNWRGTAWIPTNYMIFHGLMRYGYKAIARDLAYRTVHMALDENPVTREYYDSDTGRGNGMNPFWGWSSLAYIMPLEYETGYDPTDFQTKIKPLLSAKLHVPGP
jgi:hypothetical protein